MGGSPEPCKQEDKQQADAVSLTLRLWSAERAELEFARLEDPLNNA